MPEGRTILQREPPDPAPACGRAPPRGGPQSTLPAAPSLSCPTRVRAAQEGARGRERAKGPGALEPAATGVCAARGPD
eukprot:15463468-Alexandrium_andersonii.AAC.1